MFRQKTSMSLGLSDQKWGELSISIDWSAWSSPFSAWQLRPQFLDPAPTATEHFSPQTRRPMKSQWFRIPDLEVGGVSRGIQGEMRLCACWLEEWTDGRIPLAFVVRMKWNCWVGTMNVQWDNSLAIEWVSKQSQGSLKSDWFIIFPNDLIISSYICYIPHRHIQQYPTWQVHIWYSPHIPG